MLNAQSKKNTQNLDNSLVIEHKEEWCLFCYECNSALKSVQVVNWYKQILKRLTESSSLIHWNLLNLQTQKMIIDSIKTFCSLHYASCEARMVKKLV